MGWIATIASSLIAVMFVYNWFSRETTPSASTEEDDRLGRSPVIIAKQDLVDTDGGQGLEHPTPQSQALVILTPSESDQSPTGASNQEGIKSNSNSNSKSQSSPSQSTMMPPPSPPAIMPPPTISAPPRSKSPPRLKPPTIGRLPAPAAPRPGGGALRPPPSAASSLRVPPTKVLSNASMAPSSLMPPPKKASKQVTLEPGHSPLDWAALTSDPKNKLRGKDAPEGLIRVTPSMLKAQNGRKDRDAWTVFQGKVYNITPYLPFHPGGKGELLRGAGKDSAKLFMEVHPWVNWDGMLDNRLDEMD